MLKHIKFNHTVLITCGMCFRFLIFTYQLHETLYFCPVCTVCSSFLFGNCIYGCICRCRMNSQLPKGSHVSPECKDLLMSLLRHDPRERITFDEFFAHDFLDLAYAPTKENYEKAVELIQKAVKMDAERNSREAFHLYCEALRYFIPIVTSKKDRHKRRNYLIHYSL